ncbi:hypothetical protein DL768_011131 [Monosporascus sp. mg162]|nr:hypothetical protein DL768_011131 [Monosporascus sp. mg162]
MPHNIQPFVFLPAYNIVACTECRFGCIGGKVETYLNTAEYVRKSAPEKRGIGDRVRRVLGVFLVQAQLQRLRFPDPEAAANPYLRAPETDGLAYRRYPRAASGWFEVERGRRRPGGEGDGTALAGAAPAEREGAANTGGGGGGAEEEKRRWTADGPGGVDAESTWVKEMGWAKHFAGADLVELYEAGAGPIFNAARKKLRDAAAKKKQRRLARLGESFDREITRYVERFDAVPSAGSGGTVDIGIGVGVGVGVGAAAATTAGRILASATGRHLGVKLMVTDYRHVAIELGRKIRSLVIRQFEVDIGADDDGGGSGSGGQVADGEYGYDEDPATGEARIRRRIKYIWNLQATYGNAIVQYFGDAGGGVPAPPASVSDTEGARKKYVSAAAAGGGDGNG